MIGLNEFLESDGGVGDHGPRLRFVLSCIYDWFFGARSPKAFVRIEHLRMGEREGVMTLHEALASERIQRETMYYHSPLSLIFTAKKAHGFRPGWRIVLIGVIWIFIFTLASLAEGNLVVKDYDIRNTQQMGFAEDVFILSFILSFVLILLAARAAFDRFWAIFGDQGANGNFIGIMDAEHEDLLKKLRPDADLICHRRGRSKLLFLILAILTMTYFIMSVIGLWQAPATESWIDSGKPVAFIAWACFALFVLIIIGIGLAWRVVAVVYETRRIVRLADEMKILAIRTPVSADIEGVGRIYSFAILIALVPLAPTPALVAWIFFHGTLLLVQAIGAALVMATVSVAAFYCTAGTLASIIRRHNSHAILSISQEIDRLFNQLEKASANRKKEDVEDLSHITERVDTLLALLDSKKAESVWPFESTKGLIGAVAAEMLAVIGSAVI